MNEQRIARSLLEMLRDHRMFIPTVLAGLCGLRRGEIAALRWRHVDLTAGQGVHPKIASERLGAFQGRGLRLTCIPMCCRACKPMQRPALTTRRSSPYRGGPRADIVPAPPRLRGGFRGKWQQSGSNQP